MQVPNTEKILRMLKEKLKDDIKYDKIFGSMCTPPLDFARNVAENFAEINLGDPGLFPNAVQMEQEVLNAIADILHAPSTWKGTITSGGSEGNILGCWAARNWGEKVKGVEEGNILIPKSAHISFEKAVDLLDLNVKWIDLTDSYQMNLHQIEKEIDHKTIGIIGIAGTTGTGACDNIVDLNDLVKNQQIYVHIDAAHGGMMFPFMKDKYKFDFLSETVCSVSVDTHKILGSLMPCGSIIYRSVDYTDVFAKDIDYLSGGPTKQLTITGTRPGAPVIASWVILCLLGNEYIKKRVNNSLRKTNYLVNKLKKTKAELVFKPHLNIVGIRAKTTSTKNLVDLLRKKGWQVSLYSTWARIVVMPHVTIPMIDRFIEDLTKIMQSLR